MSREDALEFVQQVHDLSKRDTTFCRELASQLTEAEQSVLRSFLREAGHEFDWNWALDPRERSKGANE
jgi:hypothetical protein